MKRFAVVITAVVVLGVVPAALAASSLSGTYKTTITGSTQFGGTLNGAWAIKFTPGAFHVSQNGKAVVHGKDTVKGNVITFKESPGPQSCPTKGTYRFTLHGPTLNFKRIHDSTSGACAGRVFVLKHTFTRS